MTGATTVTVGLKGIKRIDEFELKDKHVFLRVDFNVPMDGAKITDDTRIRAALPTIKYAMEKGAKLVLASHLGRPESKEDRAKFSLERVATRLGELLGIEVLLIDEPTSDAPKGLVSTLKSSQVVLLENVRFEPGEAKNSREFALTLASYTDIYINDAFGASHRAHATIEALPTLVEQKGIGFLIAKEIEMLDKLLHSPTSPYMAILGGAKVSDKIQVIENMISHIDVFFIGGAMAYTFLAAQGVQTGLSKVEKDRVPFAGEMLKRIETRGKRCLLPVDHVITQNIKDTKNIKTTQSAQIPEGWFAVDIGPKTRELFRKELQKAKTVFWNGPMGIFEMPEFAKGTFAVAETLSQLTSAITIVGGGDSAAAAEASGYAGMMTHISTGGGASLEYLQGDKLPGLEVLRKRIPSSSAVIHANKEV